MLLEMKRSWHNWRACIAKERCDAPLAVQHMAFAAAINTEIHNLKFPKAAEAYLHNNPAEHDLPDSPPMPQWVIVTLTLWCVFVWFLLIGYSGSVLPEDLTRHNEEQAALKVNKEVLFSEGCRHPTHTRRENIAAYRVDGSQSIWLRGNSIEIYCTDKPVVTLPIPEPEPIPVPEPEPIPEPEPNPFIRAELSLNGRDWHPAPYNIPVGSEYFLRMNVSGYPVERFSIYCCKGIAGEAQGIPHGDEITLLPNTPLKMSPHSVPGTREIYWDTTNADGTNHTNNFSAFEVTGEFVEPYTATAIISGRAPTTRTDGTKINAGEYSHFVVRGEEINTGFFFQEEFSAKGFAVGACISSEHELPEGIWDVRIRFVDTYNLSSAWSDPVRCTVSEEAEDTCTPSSSGSPCEPS